MDLMVQLAECEVELNKLKDLAKKILLTEEFIEFGAIDRMFDETSKMLDAAKRGLGLTNKLKDSASRTKFRSRVMGNLNRIRAKLMRITKALSATHIADSGDDEEDYGKYPAGEHPDYDGPYDAAMMDPESER